MTCETSQSFQCFVHFVHSSVFVLMLMYDDIWENESGRSRLNEQICQHSQLDFSSFFFGYHKYSSYKCMHMVPNYGIFFSFSFPFLVCSVLVPCSSGPYLRVLFASIHAKSIGITSQSHPLHFYHFASISDSVSVFFSTAQHTRTHNNHNIT